MQCIRGGELYVYDLHIVRAYYDMKYFGIYMEIVPYCIWFAIFPMCWEKKRLLVGFKLVCMNARVQLYICIYSIECGYISTINTNTHTDNGLLCARDKKKRAQ